MVQFIVSHASVLLLIVYLVDKLLEAIPSINGNSLFQLFHSVVAGQVLKSRDELSNLLPRNER